MTCPTCRAKATVGRRVYPNMEQGGALSLREGEYGKTIQGEWLARPPGCSLGSLEDHEVEEHEDGTITVTPSIDAGIWHGYLRRGVWSEA